MSEYAWRRLKVAGILLLAITVNAQNWRTLGPAPRWGHSAVLDTSNDAMIIFGGQVTGANATRLLDKGDLWRLNTNTLSWTELNPSGTPPAGRLWHSAVYDSEHNRMILFGGAEGFSSPCA